jgi:hypothetical protein
MMMLAAPPALVTVIIEDYEFSLTEISVCVGTTVRFALADDVPHHAEHELVGRSKVKELRFTSPLLQVLNLVFVCTVCAVCTACSLCACMFRVRVVFHTCVYALFPF